MGGQAGEKHRWDVLAGPGQQGDSVGPEGLVLDDRFDRVGSGDDEDVGAGPRRGRTAARSARRCAGDGLAPGDPVHGVEAECRGGSVPEPTSRRPRNCRSVSTKAPSGMLLTRAHDQPGSSDRGRRSVSTAPDASRRVTTMSSIGSDGPLPEPSTTGRCRFLGPRAQIERAEVSLEQGVHLERHSSSAWSGVGSGRTKASGMPVEIIGMVGTRDASEIKGPLVDGPGRGLDGRPGHRSRTTWSTSPGPTKRPASTGSWSATAPSAPKGGRWPHRSSTTPTS